MQSSAPSSPASPSLEFAESSSRAVALHGGMVSKIAQYAPRISAILKLGTYGSFTGSGITSALAAPTTTALVAASFTIASGILLLAAGGIMMLYGNREKQQERAAKLDTKEKEDASSLDPISRIFHEIAKVASPSKYPIESASGLGIAASICLTVAGFAAPVGNLYLISMGLLGILATAVALFGKEKTSAPNTTESGLVFEKSQSSIMGLTEQNEKAASSNPVRTSSLILILAGLIALAHGYKNNDIFFLAAGVSSLVANVLMAVFVHKNDYNVNAAKQNPTPAAPDSKVSAASTSRLQDLPSGVAIA